MPREDSWASPHRSTTANILCGIFGKGRHVTYVPQPFHARLSFKTASSVASRLERFSSSIMPASTNSAASPLDRRISPPSRIPGRPYPEAFGPATQLPSRQTSLVYKETPRGLPRASYVNRLPRTDNARRNERPEIIFVLKDYSRIGPAKCRSVCHLYQMRRAPGPPSRERMP